MSTYPQEVSKTPTRDEQVQELPSAQGLLAANKNISFLRRFSRDPQYSFFKSQPGDETKGHFTGRRASRLTEKQGRCLTAPQKPTCINCQLHTPSFHTAKKAPASQRSWSNIWSSQVWLLQVSPDLPSLSSQVFRNRIEARPAHPLR